MNQYSTTPKRRALLSQLFQGATLISNCRQGHRPYTLRTPDGRTEFVHARTARGIMESPEGGAMLRVVDPPVGQPADSLRTHIRWQHLTKKFDSYEEYRQHYHKQVVPMIKRNIKHNKETA
jgi:hypothetical protein